MIRFTFSLFFILLVISNSFGQNIKPNESLLTMADYQFKYYSKIRNTLLKDNYNNTILYFIVLPSFKAEFTFRIVKSKGENYGVVTRATENIWYSKDVENLDVKKFTSLMKSEDVDLLLKSSELILSKAEYTNDLNFTVDGVSYVLANNNKSGTFRTGDKISYYHVIKSLERIIEQIINEEDVSLDESEIKLLENFNKTTTNE